MLLNKLFKSSNYSDSCRELLIPRLCIIRLWFGDALVIRKPDGNRTNLDDYTHFEAQVVPAPGTKNRFPDGFPILLKEFWFSNQLYNDEHYYKLVPREILERFIVDLMRANNMCPGPWMTEEEKGAPNVPC